MMLAVIPTLLLVALMSCSMAYYEPPLLQALAAPSADHETTSYLLPRLSAKFRPQGDWESAPDPRFYVLTETERESNQVNTETPGRPDRLATYHVLLYQSSVSFAAFVTLYTSVCVCVCVCVCV